METGATLAVDGITNPQIAYGEDATSRIVFTMKNDAHRLTSVLLNDLNEVVARAVPRPGTDRRRGGGWWATRRCIISFWGFRCVSWGWRPTMRS